MSNDKKTDKKPLSAKPAKGSDAPKKAGKGVKATPTDDVTPLKSRHWFFKTVLALFSLGSIGLIIGVLVFIIVFIVWSNMAILDEVTKGEGQVIPSSRVQTIQNLEGGILSEILVNTGSIVEPGDVLLRIDNSMAKSTYNEEQTRYNNLRARIIRLESEVSDKALKFPDDLILTSP